MRNQIGSTEEASQTDKEELEQKFCCCLVLWDWVAQMSLWKMMAAIHWILGEEKEKAQNYGITHTSPTTKTFSSPLIWSC